MAMLAIVNNTNSNGIPFALNRGADANPVNGITRAGVTPAGIDKGYRNADEAATPEVATPDDRHDANRTPLANNGTALEPVVSRVKQNALRFQEALTAVENGLSKDLSAHERYAGATERVVKQLHERKENGKGLPLDCVHINSLHDAYAELQLSRFLKEDFDDILIEFSDVALDISAVLDQSSEGARQRRSIDALAAGEGSLADIWDQLSRMIDETKKANLDDYASAVDRYTSMYQSISDILTALSSWVTAEGSDKMKVNFKEIKKTLESLLKKYDPPGTDQIIAGTPTKGLTKADAEAICEKLGLDLKCCYKNPDGTYCVIPDLSQIHTMVNNLPGDSDNYEISVVSYNAWKSGFDAQVNRIEEALQTRGQKYGNSFSRFENFHKTISSIIQAMADMLAKFLQF